MLSAALVRGAGSAAIAGGVLWIVLRPLVATTWNNPTFGLTYEDYNRLMVAPLALLLLGALSLHARYAAPASRWARRGLLATVLGFTLMLLGVVVEFYFAGGVSTGDWTGFLVGWLVFLLGYAATTIGLVAFGVAARRRALLGRWSALPLAMGVVGLLWPFFAEVWLVLNVLIQVLFGLGWVALGALLFAAKSRSGPAPGTAPRADCLEQIGGRAVSEGVAERAGASSRLSRWGGLAAALGGALFVAKEMVDLFDTPPYRWDVSDELVFLALLLFAGAPIGLHARLARRAGRLGWAGTALAAAGGLLAAGGGFATWNLQVKGSGPVGPWSALGVGLLALYLGALLLGVAALRTRVLGQWSALPLAVAVLPLALGGMVLLLSGLGIFSNSAGHPSFAFSRVLGKALLVLVGLSWGVLGYALWRDGGDRHMAEARGGRLPERAREAG